MKKHPVEKISVKHFIAACLLFSWGMMVELFHPDIEGIKMALVILCVSAVFFCVTIFKMFWGE